MSVFHEDVLRPAQRGALEGLAAVLAPGKTYLGGGMALALRLGHRGSRDLDWFDPAGLTQPSRLSKTLTREVPRFSSRLISEGTIHGVVGGVKVNFLGYDYPLLSLPETWVETGARIASIEDLACMKLSAIIQRGIRRDFVDLWAVREYGMDLGELLKNYRKKYEVTDEGHALRALCYFDDAERDIMPDLRIKLTWKGVKAALGAWVKAYVG